MCLAIPGKVLDTYDQRGLRMAKVQFGGILREACLEYVPEIQIGEYVLVHVGFAISRIDEAEAERTYQALRDLDQLTELESPVVEEIDPGVIDDEVPRRIPQWQRREQDSGGDASHSDSAVGADGGLRWADTLHRQERN